MNQSEKLNEIAAALAPALARIKNIPPDSKAKIPLKAGGSFEYKFLSLPDLTKHVRDVFKDVGLAFMQEVSAPAAGAIGVTTRILHLSGQWIDMGPLYMPADGGARDIGSAITYARRYALAAAVGLAADEDDDGEKATRPTSAGDAFAEARPRQSSGTTEPKEPPPSVVPDSTEDGDVEGEGHATATDPEEGGPSEVETPASGDLEAALEEARAQFAPGKSPKIADARIVAAAGHPLADLSAADLLALVAKHRELTGASA